MGYLQASAKYCPVCSIANKRSLLIPRQINFKLAVYLCEDNTCIYPEGFDLVEVTQRSLKDLFIEKRQQPAEKIDLDNWLEDFIATEGKNLPAQISDDQVVSDDDLSKIIDELSKSNSDSDLDLQYDNDLLNWVDTAFEKCILEKEDTDYLVSDAVTNTFTNCLNANTQICYNNPKESVQNIENNTALVSTSSNSDSLLWNHESNINGSKPFVLRTYSKSSKHKNVKLQNKQNEIKQNESTSFTSRHLQSEETAKGLNKYKNCSFITVVIKSGSVK